MQGFTPNVKRLQDVVDESFADYACEIPQEEHQVLPDVGLPHCPLSQPFEAMKMNPKLLAAMGRQMTVGGDPSPASRFQQGSPGKSQP